MQRRLFLNGAGASLALVSAGTRAQTLPSADTNAPNTVSAPMTAMGPPIGNTFAPPVLLAPLRASADRIIEINVCTRPFRSTGPRIESERIGRKTVIHNYGHGGSGWSLSWGSAMMAMPLVKATGEKSIAVIGCGAVGLTTAVMAQRAGLKVHIYAKERMPLVRSSWATGVWSPDSRVCTLAGATPEFEQQWEAMARFSFRMYTNLLGVAGDPVEWRDGYALSDVPFGTSTPPPEDEPTYPKLEERLLHDLRVTPQPLQPGQHPFKVPFVRRYSRMTFNISSYSRVLMNDFLLGGGQIETAEFTSPKDFAHIKEKTIINSTGYGARALMNDESIIPVRGQSAKLIPQPEVNYGLSYSAQHISMTPRRDGLLVQASLPGDFNNTDITPDRATSEAAVNRLGALFATG